MFLVSCIEYEMPVNIDHLIQNKGYINFKRVILMKKLKKKKHFSSFSVSFETYTVLQVVSHILQNSRLFFWASGKFWPIFIV